MFFGLLVNCVVANAARGYVVVTVVFVIGSWIMDKTSDGGARTSTVANTTLDNPFAA